MDKSGSEERQRLMYDFFYSEQDIFDNPFKGGFNMQVTKMEYPNTGVKCMVNTCHYYMRGDYCSAEKIQVGPKNASTTEDTDCVTFVPENSTSVR